MPDNAVSDTSTATADPVPPPKIAASLRRFRIAAFIVGVALIVLVIAMVLRYGFDQRWAVAAWGPVHGALYFGYFLLVLDLSFKARWSPVGTLLVILAGTVPVASFWAERVVTAKVRAGRKI